MSKKNILLGVSGSISAYKACDLVRRIREEGFNVTVVMTPSAAKLVQPLTLQVLSDNPVYTDMFGDRPSMAHIRLAEDAEMFVIAPATAHRIGLMAAGLAPDLLSTLALSFQGHVLIAPAMNTNMWKHPSVQENVNILMKRGIKVMTPPAGKLACGMSGEGRLPDIDDIVDEMLSILKKKH